MSRIPRKNTVATAAEIARMHAALCAVSPLGADDLATLPLPQRLELAPGALFLRAGERAQRVGTVISGGLREYFELADGADRTRSFNLPGDFAGSLSDLLSGEPARTAVVAAVPSVVLTLDWAAYLKLVETRPAWQRFGRVVAERLYRAKAQREYELLALDAAARYRMALLRWPRLEQIFTQRDIASYVGITPVHLSRLRSRQ